MNIKRTNLCLRSTAILAAILIGFVGPRVEIDYHRASGESPSPSPVDLLCHYLQASDWIVAQVDYYHVSNGQERQISSCYYSLSRGRYYVYRTMYNGIISNGAFVGDLGKWWYSRELGLRKLDEDGTLLSERVFGGSQILLSWAKGDVIGLLRESEIEKNPDNGVEAVSFGKSRDIQLFIGPSGMPLAERHSGDDMSGSYSSYRFQSIVIGQGTKVLTSSGESGFTAVQLLASAGGTTVKARQPLELRSAMDLSMLETNAQGFLPATLTYYSSFADYQAALESEWYRPELVEVIAGPVRDSERDLLVKLAKGRPHLLLDSNYSLLALLPIGTGQTVELTAPD